MSDSDTNMLDTDSVYDDPTCYSLTGVTYRYPIWLHAVQEQVEGLENDLEAMTLDPPEPSTTGQPPSTDSEGRFMRFGAPVTEKEMTKLDRSRYSSLLSGLSEYTYPPKPALDGHSIDRDGLIIDVLGKACANPVQPTTVLEDGTRTIGKVTLSNGETIEPTELRFSYSFMLNEADYEANAQNCEGCRARTCTKDRRTKVSPTDFHVVDITFLTKEENKPETKVHVDRAIVKGERPEYQTEWEIQCIGDREVDSLPTDWESEIPVSKIWFDILDENDPIATFDYNTEGLTIVLEDAVWPQVSLDGMAVVNHVVPTKT